MTEENLKEFGWQDLHNEMVKAIRELSALYDDDASTEAYTEKKEEIRLIHAFIQSQKQVQANTDR